MESLLLSTVGLYESWTTLSVSRQKDSFLLSDYWGLLQLEAVRSQAVHLLKILFPDFCISNDTGNEIVSHENSSSYWINMNSRVLSSAQIRFPHPAAGLWASDSISRRESPSSVTVGRRANMDKKIVSTAPFDVFCFATLSYITDPLSSIVWVVHPLNMVST